MWLMMWMIFRFEETKKVREELMEEKRVFVEDVNAEYESEEFNFL